MVIYTCIRKLRANHYECYKGIVEVKDNVVEDYRLISIPGSSLNFEILKNFHEMHLVKLNLHPKYRNASKFYY